LPPPPFPKIWQAKKVKIRRDFGQLQIWIASISGTD